MTKRGNAASVFSAPWIVVPMTRASSGPPNSLMSAPAAKMRSPPVTTTAPGRSAASASAWARSLRISAPDRALTFGLSRVRTATPSSRRSRRTSSGSSAIRRPYRLRLLRAYCLQQGVGRRPRIEAPVEHARLDLLVALVPTQLPGPGVEAADDDGAQLVAQPAVAALLEQPGLLGVAPVVEHRLPQLGHALTAGSD